MATKNRAEQGGRKKSQKARLPVPATVFGWLCAQQVRDALGGCSPRKLRQMIASGEFPRANARLGRFPRWTPRLVNEYCLLNADGEVDPSEVVAGG